MLVVMSKKEFDDHVHMIKLSSFVYMFHAGIKLASIAEKKYKNINISGLFNFFLQRLLPS